MLSFLMIGFTMVLISNPTLSGKAIGPCTRLVSGVINGTDGQAELLYRQLYAQEAHDEGSKLARLSRHLVELERQTNFNWDPDSKLFPDFLSDGGQKMVGYIVARVAGNVTFLSENSHPVHALVWTKEGFKIALSDGDFGFKFFVPLAPSLLKPFEIDIEQIRKRVDEGLPKSENTKAA